MLKLGRRARRHFVTLIEIRVHLIRGIFNLDPRALLLTEGKKRSWEPRNKVSSHWFSWRTIKTVSN